MSDWFGLRRLRAAAPAPSLADSGASAGLPNQCGVDQLLAQLHAQIAARRGARTFAAPSLGGEDRDYAPGNFAVFFLELRRSDRSRALAGLANAEAVLTAVRRRIAETLRESDRFAIFGVEEILLVLPEVGNAGLALLVATRLVQRLQEPVDDAGGAVRLRPAIGCALFPQHGDDAEALIAAADRACHNARDGESGFRMAERGEAGKDSDMLARELHAALQGNRLEVWFQPQYDVKRGTYDSAEALIRWPRPAGEPHVAPATVADLAEHHGLMPMLTMFVLHTALREAVRLAGRGIDLRIAVNLSASMLTDPNLPRIVAQTLEVWDVRPDRLTLEVTENTVMRDVEEALAVLHALKRLGTRLSIDDFGTGYSSFAYLRRMPLDELKIDKLFVRNLVAASNATRGSPAEGDLRIVRSIIDIAHNFDLSAVAEGVEDAATLAQLSELGCDVIQGYVACRPMPSDKLMSWWATRPVFG